LLKQIDGFGPSALSALDPTTGDFLEHRQLRRDPRYKAVWDNFYANELGRLCQGIGSGNTPTKQQIGGTNTFFLIDYPDIPLHKCKEICHTMVVCEVRPEKDDPDRIRITIGGNRICYPGNVGTNSASLELVKLLLNTVLSRKGAWFSTIDLKNFYLDTPMPDPEYVRIELSDIPDEFIKEYNLTGRDLDGWIYFEFVRDVMVFPKRASLPMIFFRLVLLPRGSMKQLPLLASGAISGVLCNSASLWMILVWNTLVLNVSTICLIYSRNFMGYNLTWPATNLLASQSNGIIHASAADSACQATLITFSSNSSTLALPSHVARRSMPTHLLWCQDTAHA
jgi:hypothetical protein